METEENRYCTSVCVCAYVCAGFHVGVRGRVVKKKKKWKKWLVSFMCALVFVCVWERKRERCGVCPASSDWLDKESLVGLIFSSIPAHLVTREHLQWGNPTQTVKDSPEWKEDEKAGELSEREEGKNTNNKSKSVQTHLSYKIYPGRHYVNTGSFIFLKWDVVCHWNTKYL